MRVESLQSRAISVLIALVLTALPCLAQSTSSKCESRSDRERSVGRFYKQGPGAVARNGKSQSLVSPINAVKRASIRLPLGTYQIHIEAAGFKAQDVDDVDLSTGPHRRK